MPVAQPQGLRLDGRHAGDAAAERAARRIARALGTTCAARAARNAAARTVRRREVLVAAVPDVPERTAESFDPDAARAVVEEVGRLPDPLRPRRRSP